MRPGDIKYVDVNQDGKIDAFDVSPIGGPINPEIVYGFGLNMKWKDFEDAIQSATAEYVHADYIITRNIKDFTQSKVMALTPAELLARI